MTLSIGALAKAAGVSADTVRYYERSGLLPMPNRATSGYRQYSRGDVDRLRFIRQAKVLGFTLGDINDLLRLQDGHGSRADVREKARARIADLDGKIRELTRLRDALSALEKSCHGNGPVASCPIIEGLHAVPLPGGREAPP